MRLVAALRVLFGRTGLPDGFAARLDADEHVLATAAVAGGGAVVASSHGLWFPWGRRVGWHLVSKATWGGGVLVVVAAEEIGSEGGAVLLADVAPVRLPLAEPGRVPQIVQERVTTSIRSRHHRALPGGGAWFVQRKVPGRDGVQLQVRADPGTDERAVRRVAAEVAGTVRRIRESTPERSEP